MCRIQGSKPIDVGERAVRGEKNKKGKRGNERGTDETVRGEDAVPAVH